MIGGPGTVVTIDKTLISFEKKGKKGWKKINMWYIRGIKENKKAEENVFFIAEATLSEKNEITNVNEVIGKYIADQTSIHIIGMKLSVKDKKYHTEERSISFVEQLNTEDVENKSDHTLYQTKHTLFAEYLAEIWKEKFNSESGEILYNFWYQFRQNYTNHALYALKLPDITENTAIKSFAEYYRNDWEMTNMDVYKKYFTFFYIGIAHIFGDRNEKDRFTEHICDAMSVLTFDQSYPKEIAMLTALYQNIKNKPERTVNECVNLTKIIDVAVNMLKLVEYPHMFIENFEMSATTVLSPEALRHKYITGTFWTDEKIWKRQDEIFLLQQAYFEKTKCQDQDLLLVLNEQHDLHNELKEFHDKRQGSFIQDKRKKQKQFCDNIKYCRRVGDKNLNKKYERLLELYYDQGRERYEELEIAARILKLDTNHSPIQRSPGSDIRSNGKHGIKYIYKNIDDNKKETLILPAQKRDITIFGTWDKFSIANMRHNFIRTGNPTYMGKSSYKIWNNPMKTWLCSVLGVPKFCLQLDPHPFIEKTVYINFEDQKKHSFAALNYSEEHFLDLMLEARKVSHKLRLTLGGISCAMIDVFSCHGTPSVQVIPFLNKNSMLEEYRIKMCGNYKWTLEQSGLLNFNLNFSISENDAIKYEVVMESSYVHIGTPSTPLKNDAFSLKYNDYIAFIKACHRVGTVMCDNIDGVKSCGIIFEAFTKNIHAKVFPIFDIRNECCTTNYCTEHVGYQHFKQRMNIEKNILQDTFDKLDLQHLN